MAFLTLEDPNVEIKGSRDPLGAQPIWAAFARHAIVNLTTQTTSIRGFTVLLLGRYFAEQLVEENLVPREDALDVFLRMEQVAGYVRYAGCNSEAIRGIDKVKRYLGEQGGKPRIGVEQKDMILSDQKVYGLWGLYTVAARVSGLLPEGAHGVTTPARDFIHANYGSKLGDAGKALRKLLIDGGVLDTRPGRDPVFEGLRKLLPEKFSTAEREFYGRRIRDGIGADDKEGRQVRLRQLMQKLGRLDEPVGRDDVVELRKLASRNDPDLAMKLERILKIEAVLAPAAALFDLLLARNGRSPADIAANIRQRWGRKIPNLSDEAYRDLRDEIRRSSSVEVEAAINSFNATLVQGDFEGAIKALLDWNSQVMARRGGGPWATLNARRVLDVGMPAPEKPMPEKDELGSLWRNDYFMSSLRGITLQLAA